MNRHMGKVFTVLVVLATASVARAQQFIEEQIPFDDRLIMDCKVLKSAQDAQFGVNQKLGNFSARLAQCLRANCSEEVINNLKRQINDHQNDLLLRQAELELIGKRQVQYVSSATPSQSPILRLFLDEPVTFNGAGGAFASFISIVPSRVSAVLVKEGVASLVPAPTKGRLDVRLGYSYLDEALPFTATLMGRIQNICDRAARNNGEIFSLTRSFTPSETGPYEIRTKFSFGINEPSATNNIDLTIWIRPILADLFTPSPQVMDTLWSYYRGCAWDETVVGRVTETNNALGGAEEVLGEGDYPSSWVGGSNDEPPVFFPLPKYPDLFSTETTPRMDLKGGSAGKTSQSSSLTTEEYTIDWAGIERLREDRGLPKVRQERNIELRSRIEYLFQSISILRKNIHAVADQATWPSTEEFLRSAKIALDTFQDKPRIRVQLEVNGVDVGTLVLSAVGHQTRFGLLIDQVEDTGGLIYACRRPAPVVNMWGLDNSEFIQPCQDVRCGAFGRP